MSTSDKFLVAFFLVWNALVVAFFLAGLPGWAWLWLWIEASVIVAELWSKWKKAKTLTQLFRAWAIQHTLQALLILGGMIVAWGFLILHLGWR